MSENSNTNHSSASGNAAQLEIVNNVQAITNFTPTTRLTSYLAPRDLTLTGNSVKLDKPRKVYIPNLNAQRKKKEEYATLYFFIDIKSVIRTYYFLRAFD